MEGDGFTLDIVASYETINASDCWAGPPDSLGYWYDDTGDLVDTVFPYCEVSTGRIMLTAATDAQVFLESFDVAAYAATADVPSGVIRVYCDGIVCFADSTLIPALGHATFSPGVHGNEVVIEWDADWDSADIVVDNVDFNQGPGSSVKVVDVAFDFEESANDGLDLRINLDEDVCTINPGISDVCPDDRGEWVEGLRNHPASFVSTAYYSLAPIQVVARFKAEPGEVSSAIFSATSPSLGTFSEVAATFDPDGFTPWLSITTSASRPSSITKLTETIQRSVRDIDGGGSAAEDINSSGPHELHHVLASGYPWSGSGFQIQHEPWSEVLEHSVSWAWAAATVDSVANRVTRALHDSMSLRYHPDGVPSYAVFPGPPFRYKLKAFLSGLGSDAKHVNCHDLGQAVAIFSSALGAPVDWRFVVSPLGPRRDAELKPIVTNMIDPIGPSCLLESNTCSTNNMFWWDGAWPQYDAGDPPPVRKGGYREHGFAALGMVFGSPTAYDATHLVDVDLDPDDPPAVFDYVLGKPLSLGGYLYDGLRDWNNFPPSDPTTGSWATFSVDAE